MIPPTQTLLARVSHLLASRREERLVSPVNERHAFSTTDFSRLVPQLEDPDAAGDHVLRIMRTLAADSPVDHQGLVYEHPSLFLRPSATAYARHTYSRSLARLTTTTCAGEEPERVLADLRAAFEAVPESEWGAAQLMDVIHRFPARYTAGLEGEEAAEKEKAVQQAMYTLLRLVLTGDPDRGSKPAKLQLLLLGKAETMVRFKMCGAGEEGL